MLEKFSSFTYVPFEISVSLRVTYKISKLDIFIFNLLLRCDLMIAEVNERYERQYSDVMTLQMLVAQLPKINAQVLNGVLLSYFLSSYITNTNRVMMNNNAILIHRVHSKL